MWALLFFLSQAYGYLDPLFLIYLKKKLQYMLPQDVGTFTVPILMGIFRGRGKYRISKLVVASQDYVHTWDIVGFRHIAKLD
jgi:hypothetical protein